jgi:CheY-like chemotaxis protein
LQTAEAQPSAPPAAKGNLSGRKILVLENDPAVVEAMEGLLANWGCEFKVGRSTRDALEALESLTWIPDLIIADHHLDHGNLGTETLAQLFTILPTKVPAILATADASETVVEDAKRLGVEHMPKPVKPAQLRALATHLINGGE